MGQGGVSQEVQEVHAAAQEELRRQPQTSEVGPLGMSSSGEVLGSRQWRCAEGTQVVVEEQWW